VFTEGLNEIGPNFQKRYRMSRMEDYFSLKLLIRNYNKNCDKEVHPFTHFNDKELFDYMIRQNECGYDEEVQL
jgi:hypothetical protein